MGIPKNYVMRGPNEGEVFISSATLPKLMDVEQVKETSEYDQVKKALHTQLVEQGWREGGVPLEESKALRPVGMDIVVDEDSANRKRNIRGLPTKERGHRNEVGEGNRA